MTDDDVLHSPGSATTRWSRVNTAEAFPRVLTPLTWTFCRETVERGYRSTMRDLGVLRRSEVRVPGAIDSRVCNVFYGRFATNIDQARYWADLTPGTSADALELQIFGSVRPDVASRPSRRRYPAIAVRMPFALATVHGRVRRMHRAVDAWWRDSIPTAAESDEAGCRALFRDAMEHLEHAMRVHGVSSLFNQMLYEQLRKLAVAAGRSGLETALLVAQGESEEARTVDDLWQLSHSELDMDAFLAIHGFHGPAEAELSVPVWRMDPTPVAALVRHYESLPDGARPRLGEAERVNRRRDAEREVVAALPRHRRPAARLLLRLAARVMPLRELSKTSYLQSLDVGRAAASRLGTLLVDRGIIDDFDDVFFLTAAELTGDLPDELPRLAAARRRARNDYETFDIDLAWTGEPQRRPTAQHPDGSSSVIEGIGVSPGVVEGTARVLVEPDADALVHGEILVCRTTDPSWASLFLLASALVIDIGGPISHGAIVAREFGIPAVINTVDGTERICTGDLLRVDGTIGVVQVLSRRLDGS